VSVPRSRAGCRSVGNIPCRGVPQTGHASAFKPSSAPQHEQKAAMFSSPLAVSLWMNPETGRIQTTQSSEAPHPKKMRGPFKPSFNLSGAVAETPTLRSASSGAERLTDLSLAFLCRAPPSSWFRRVVEKAVPRASLPAMIAFRDRSTPPGQHFYCLLQGALGRPEKGDWSGFGGGCLSCGPDR
jgi:hypothetical protein